jgi:flagellar biosynthesis protein FliQ
MSPDAAVDIVRETVLVALVVGGPILAVGLLIGLLVSVLQAATQIQEQTLSFVPKIVGMAIAAVVIVPWMGVKLMDFTVRMFAP